MHRTRTLGSTTYLLHFCRLSRSGAASCVVSDLGPKQYVRRQTAQQLLQLMSGGSIQDASREKHLRASMHMIRSVSVPSQWRQLAHNVRLHGPGYVKNSLSTRRFLVPDIEGATECKCSLTASQAPQRFCQPQLNKFLADIFQSIPHAVQLLKLPQVGLNRFDLFHAHMFCTRETRSLGMLFHSKEYPSYDRTTFPINLGFCQQNSPLQFDEKSMDFRNMLWFQGQLCALDVGTGSLLHDDLIMDGLQDVRTVLESDFGQAVLDVNYFDSLPGPAHRKLFLC